MQSRQLLVKAMCALVASGTAAPAVAQSIDTFMPAFVTGAGVDPGVTVLSRARPGFDATGVRLGDWLFTPTLSETFGYDSNVAGYSTGTGSVFLDTKATVNLASQAPRGQISLGATVDDVEYLGQAEQSYTNWSATLAGTHALGEGEATLAYSHQQLHQIASDFGALQADAPVGYQVDDVRALYAVDLSRFTLTPILDAARYTSDDATVLGIPVSLRDQTRDVILGGAELRYALTDARSLVLVGEAIDTNYENRPAGMPTETSTTGRLLAGLDTTERGLWRLRLLLGMEVRSFQAAQYATRYAPVAEGSLIYTPNGQTTATLSLTRTIQDPADNGVQGYTLSKASLVIDRELKRTLLLQASVGFQYADPLQTGATQTNYLAGVSLTRQLNSRARLVLSYNFDAQQGADVLLSAGPGFPAALRGGNYDRHVIGLTLKLAL